MSALNTTIDAVLKQKIGPVCSTMPTASVYQAIEIMADKHVGARCSSLSTGNCWALFLSAITPAK